MCMCEIIIKNWQANTFTNKMHMLIIILAMNILSCLFILQIALEDLCHLYNNSTGVRGCEVIIKILIICQVVAIVYVKGYYLIRTTNNNAKEYY